MADYVKNSSACRKEGSLTDSPALCLTTVATTFTKRGTCKSSALFENGQDGPAAPQEGPWRLVRGVAQEGPSLRFLLGTTSPLERSPRMCLGAGPGCPLWDPGCKQPPPLQHQEPQREMGSTAQSSKCLGSRGWSGLNRAQGRGACGGPCPPPCQLKAPCHPQGQECRGAARVGVRHRAH